MMCGCVVVMGNGQVIMRTRVEKGFGDVSGVWNRVRR